MSDGLAPDREPRIRIRICPACGHPRGESKDDCQCGDRRRADRATAADGKIDTARNKPPLHRLPLLRARLCKAGALPADPGSDGATP